MTVYGQSGVILSPLIRHTPCSSDQLQQAASELTGVSHSVDVGSDWVGGGRQPAVDPLSPCLITTLSVYTLSRDLSVSVQDADADAAGTIIARNSATPGRLTQTVEK